MQMRFDRLCFAMRQQGDVVFFMCVCVFQGMDKRPPLLEEAEFNHLVPNLSETEPNLNSSQRENEASRGRKMFLFAFLTRCKPENVWTGSKTAYRQVYSWKGGQGGFIHS